MHNHVVFRLSIVFIFQMTLTYMHAFCLRHFVETLLTPTYGLMKKTKVIVDKQSLAQSCHFQPFLSMTRAALLDSMIELIPFMVLKG